MARYLTEDEIEFRASLTAVYISDYAHKLATMIKNGERCLTNRKNLELLVAAFNIIKKYQPVDVSDPDNPVQVDCLSETEIDHIYRIIEKITKTQFDAKGDTTNLNSWLALVP